MARKHVVSPPTPVRLMDAAEALFAERGFDQASVRDILDRAHVANASAINYYFGGKEELFAAVGARLLGPVQAERLSRLDAAALLTESQRLEGIVAAYVDPLVALHYGPEAEAAQRFLAWLMADPARHADRVALQPVADVNERFVEALRLLYPAVDDADLRWGVAAAAALLIGWQLGLLDAPCTRGRLPQSAESAHLRQYIVNSFTALPRRS
ncbi:TetR/AcrR family transcriptional regulator [Leifsonia sp. AG29]|uniref:TetR/AcrR family transcriptional regulator n=1 Tax=Leifsonia sp. AG29 TaxID=2598860 RepID=UPI00131E289A|nr:TetR/AcrR family transcriptional regulator [Leifsonia sp. AG29]